MVQIQTDNYTKKLHFKSFITLYNVKASLNTSTLQSCYKHTVVSSFTSNDSRCFYTYNVQYSLRCWYKHDVLHNYFLFHTKWLSIKATTVIFATPLIFANAKLIWTTIQFVPQLTHIQFTPRLSIQWKLNGLKSLFCLKYQSDNYKRHINQTFKLNP